MSLRVSAQYRNTPHGDTWVAPPSAAPPEHRQVPVTGNPTKGGRSFAIAKRDPTGRLGTTRIATCHRSHGSPPGSAYDITVANLGDGPVDPDHPIRLGPSPCPSASGYPTGTPPGPPVRGPPGRGPPPRPPGKFPGPGPPGPGGRPGRPRGPVRGPQPDPQKWALSGPIHIYFHIQLGGPGGYPPGCIFGAPGPGGPGGPKSAHFFGYLITLPVGTVLGTFFGPPGRARFGGIRGVIGGDAVWVSLYGTISHTMRSMLCLGPVRLGSMAATGPARASSARVGGT